MCYVCIYSSNESKAFMKKEIYISKGVGETRIAVKENGILAELHVDKESKERTVGNIYKGVVENVIPYYEPLIPAKKRGRHLYWTNFNLPSNLKERKSSIMESKNEVKKWSEFHDYDFRQYKGKQSIQKVARNLVDYEAGKTILDTVMGIRTKENINQTELF